MADFASGHIMYTMNENTGQYEQRDETTHPYECSLKLRFHSGEAVSEPLLTARALKHHLDGIGWVDLHHSLCNHLKQNPMFKIGMPGSNFASGNYWAGRGNEMSLMPVIVHVKNIPAIKISTWQKLRILSHFSSSHGKLLRVHFVRLRDFLDVGLRDPSAPSTVRLRELFRDKDAKRQAKRSPKRGSPYRTALRRLSTRELDRHPGLEHINWEKWKNWRELEPKLLENQAWLQILIDDIKTDIFEIPANETFENYHGTHANMPLFRYERDIWYRGQEWITRLNGLIKIQPDREKVSLLIANSTHDKDPFGMHAVFLRAVLLILRTPRITVNRAMFRTDFDGKFSKSKRAYAGWFRMHETRDCYRVWKHESSQSVQWVDGRSQDNGIQAVEYSDVFNKSSQKSRNNAGPNLGYWKAGLVTHLGKNVSGVAKGEGNFYYFQCKHRPKYLEGDYDADDILRSSNPSKLMQDNKPLFLKMLMQFSYVRSHEHNVFVHHTMTNRRANNVGVFNFDKKKGVVEFISRAMKRKRRKNRKYYQEVAIMPQHLGGLPVVIKPASAKKRARPSTAPAGRTNGKKLSKYATSTSKGENKVEARVEWDRSTNEWVISRPRDSDAWYKDWVKPDWHMEKKRALHDAVHREGLESHELDSDFSDFIHDKWQRTREEDLRQARLVLQAHMDGDVPEPIVSARQLREYAHENSSTTPALKMLINFLIVVDVFGTEDANSLLERAQSKQLQENGRGPQRLLRVDSVK
jgi:hypothetical protein